MESMTEQWNEREAHLNEILSSIDEIKSVISGRNQSFVPYTHTAEKKFSKEKTYVLVERLLQYMQEKKESEGVAFPELQRQVYEGFFIVQFRIVPIIFKKSI